MKTTTKIAIVVISIIWLCVNVRAQQLVVPIYEYRVCEVERPDHTWITGVYRIDYDADGSFKDISATPIQVSVVGKGKLSKKQLKREIALFLEAFDKPTLVFGLIFPSSDKL